MQEQQQQTTTDFHLPGRSFAEADLNPFLHRSLAAAGFTQPTPIQYYSIKQAIASTGNLVCRSKSGTGKTLAYLSIFFQHLLGLGGIESKTYCVILLPTRELAAQVYHNFKAISKSFRSVRPCNPKEESAARILRECRAMLTIGGIDFESDRQRYSQDPCHIIISTLGRLRQLVEQRMIKFCQHSCKFTFVIDEGDKLFESKEEKLKEVTHSFMQLEPRFLIFSATYSLPALKQIRGYCKFTYLHTLMKNGQFELFLTQDFSSIPADKGSEQLEPDQENLQLINIKKYIYKLKEHPKQSQFTAKVSAIKQILRQLKYQKCLIFVEKKSFLQQICQNLNEFDPLLIHGSLSQAARFRTMNKINERKLIITSDLLSRGIDVKLDLVLLFDAKQTDTFWHRIGRTGRYGRTGVAVSLDQIDDCHWKQYDSEEINDALRGITDFGHKSKKVYYGEHLTEMSRWVDYDPTQEANNNYRYLPAITETHNKPALPQFGSEQQLAEYIRRTVLSCPDCLNLMQSVNELTGYEFEILKYLAE